MEIKVDQQLGDPIDLANYILPVIAKWKLVLALILLGAITGFVISRAMPKTYQSRAVLYTKQSSGAMDLLGSLPLGISGGGGGNSGYLATLLQSDTLNRTIITRLNLTKRRAFTHGRPLAFADALEKLRRTVNVKENKGGSIDVIAKAFDPYLAANIANAAVDGLDKLVVRSSRKKADFIFVKLNETARDLHKVEDELERFLQNNDVTQIDEQTKGQIQQLGELDGKLLAIDVDLRQIDSRLSNAGELNSLVDDEVRRNALESARTLLVQKKQALQANLARLPVIATKYARLQRSIAILNKTFEALTLQNQTERITQQGEDGDYQIIDRARPILRKISPSVTLNTALGGMLGLVLGALLANAPFSTRRYGKKR